VSEAGGQRAGERENAEADSSGCGTQCMTPSQSHEIKT